MQGNKVLPFYCVILSGRDHFTTFDPRQLLRQAACSDLEVLRLPRLKH